MGEYEIQIQILVLKFYKKIRSSSNNTHKKNKT